MSKVRKIKINGVVKEIEDAEAQKKETGKGLSANDYSDAEKQKVASAYADKHTHENKSVLDGITAALVASCQAHLSSTSNPHAVTKAQVGLGNADNTSDADKPVSTATQTALNAKANADVVPAQASAQNQLADKAFVNSSIATNTAYYISNNGEPFTSVAQLEAYAGTVTNNDYAFVTGTDEQGNTYYDRYKATVNGSTATWAKEFRLNNSSFTAVQWAAITSGITAQLVASYQAHLSNTSNPHAVTYQQLGGTKPTYSYSEVGAEQSGAVSTHNAAADAHSALLAAKNIDDVTDETWTFTLEDDTTVTKTVKVGS